MEELRKCGKNGCVEGEYSKEHSMVTKFTYIKRNGKHYAYCDGCRDYMLRIEYNKKGPVKNRGMFSFTEGIYDIIDTQSNNELVWVGEGWIQSRYYQHLGGVRTTAKQFLGRAATKEEMLRYKFIPFKEEQNEIKRKMIEKVRIQRFNPKFNNQYRTNV